MELLLTIKEIEDQVYGEGISENEKEIIKKRFTDFGKIEISEKNIGPGADVMTILVVMLTVTNVFLIGDKIDKGIDGWLKLASRIKKLFTDDELTSTDIEAASLLAIQLISETENISSIEKTSEQEIALVDFSASHLFGDGRTKDDLVSKPYSYYIFSFLVNNDKYYIIGVKSHGETNLIKCFSANSPYGIKEI